MGTDYALCMWWLRQYMGEGLAPFLTGFNSDLLANLIPDFAPNTSSGASVLLLAIVVGNTSSKCIVDEFDRIATSGFCLRIAQWKANNASSFADN